MAIFDRFFNRGDKKKKEVVIEHIEDNTFSNTSDFEERVLKDTDKRFIKELSDLEKEYTRKYDENAVRKNFTLIEATAYWEAMKTTGGRPKKSSESDDFPRRNRASKITGFSTDTLSKAKQVLDSGKPELIEEMKKTDRVDKVYRELKLEKIREQTKELNALHEEHEVKKRQLYSQLNKDSKGEQQNIV